MSGDPDMKHSKNDDGNNNNNNNEGGYYMFDGESEGSGGSHKTVVRD